MDSESYDIELKARKCMNLSLKFLEIGGLWYTGKKKSFLYTLYHRFILIYSYLWTVSNYIQLYQSRNNFHKLIESMSICISLTLFLLKLDIFTAKKKKVE